jgi:4-hydroxy-3-methylbut-2-en-1-yl diphosphate reductase
LKVEIDQKSGFCFGVMNAISKAEATLKEEGFLFSLGQIVHNELEVKRLQEMGLRIISHEEYFRLKDCKVLIRTHGEPPSIYDYALKNNIELIDATCPVVLKLQQRIRAAGNTMDAENGQVVIFGHPDHAEVIALASQNIQQIIIVENSNDYLKIDPHRPVVLFSQTTKSVDDFRKLKKNIIEYSQNSKVKTYDTICRQVSNRVFHLDEFSSWYDVIIFVGGRQSSNARVLFDVCKARNKRSYFISTPDEILEEWFLLAENVGVCGATSTPQWLMEQVASTIRQF